MTTTPLRRHRLLNDAGFQHITMSEVRNLIADLHELQATTYFEHKAKRICPGLGDLCPTCKQHKENLRLAAGKDGEK